MPSEPTTPKATNSVPGSTEEKLAIEWTHYECVDVLNERGEQDVVEREHLYSVEVLQPERGKVIAEYCDRVMDYYFEHKDQRYAVFSKRDGSFYAVQTNVMIPDECEIEMRAVELEGIGVEPSLGWEVSIRVYNTSRWDLLPNQHLRERTAPAEEWLADLEGSLLPVLRERESDLAGKFRVFEKNLGVRLEDAPIDEYDVWYWAYAAVVKYEVGELWTNMKRAESQWQAIKWKLDRHLKAGQRMGISLYAPWIGIPHWLETRRYRNEAAEAETAFRQSQEQERTIQQLTDEDHIQKEIEEKNCQMLVAQELMSEIKVVSSRIQDAEEIVAYLRERKGFSVSLEESIVVGRRLEIVPRKSMSEQLSRREHVAPRIRI